MKLFFAIVVWLVVFAFLPAIAIAALVLLPIVWLVCLPFRLLHIAVEALFSFIKGVLFLPARMLGVRPTA
jgi:hypothetical protein